MIRSTLILGLLLLTQVVSAQAPNPAQSLEWAKKKCADLRFKSGTERFVNCVGQLLRSDEAASASNANKSNPTAASTIALGQSFKDCTECPEMVQIPAGTFLMGSKADPFLASPPAPDEQPQHAVSIQAFAMGKFEVTQEQWYAVMGTMPSKFKGRTLPVEQVSWDDAQAFVKKLSEKTKKKYRLPSEAEWEYAARAGTTTKYSFGDTLTRQQANVGESEVKPVGSYPANAFGLHDMHGNVWEWTEDCWNVNYNGSPANGSAWTKGDCDQRVLRGGSWEHSSIYARSAFRSGVTVGNRVNNLGFRVARTN